MPNSRDALCPEWCAEKHTSQDFQDNELVIHWKGFGSLENAPEGLVKVWAQFDKGILEANGVEIDVDELTSSNDLKILSHDCLEAARWMDATFGTNLKVITKTKFEETFVG